ncbi:MAG: hypothetical protein Q4A66_01775, partial [Eubacteriales bacterium]|nr:hypothetical protein [Eubacteriales bacterium]
MEKRKLQVMKILVLTVLLALVCCGAAMATTTAPAPVHVWKTECSHLDAFRAGNANGIYDYLKGNDIIAKGATYEADREVAATCKAVGSTYVCCDGC